VVGNSLVSAALAPVCAVCKAVLDEPLSGCVCTLCWSSVRPITPPVCDACGDPLPRGHESLIRDPDPPDRHQSQVPDPQSPGQSQSPISNPESPLCGRCIRHRSPIDRARAIGEYDGTLREIIHALKYDGRRSVAGPLAALMCARGAELLKNADCVVPVPLHWRREHWRGFNQARELSRHMRLPVVEALVRTRYTRPQIELAAERRRTNVAGAFRQRLGWLRHRTTGATRVVLVDDVSTTGATVEACARVLKESGVSQVYALTAARVVSRRRLDISRATPHTAVTVDSARGAAAPARGSASH
jgi:ComF family protein